MLGFQIYKDLVRNTGKRSERGASCSILNNRLGKLTFKLDAAHLCTRGYSKVTGRTAYGAAFCCQVLVEGTLNHNFFRSASGVVAIQEDNAP